MSLSVGNVRVCVCDMEKYEGKTHTQTHETHESIKHELQCMPRFHQVLDSRLSTVTGGSLASQAWRRGGPGSCWEPMAVRMTNGMRTTAPLLVCALRALLSLLHIATLGSVLYGSVACRISCPTEVVGIALPMLAMTQALPAIAPRCRPAASASRLQS